MPRVYCVAKAMGFNLGVLDYNLEEHVIEGFNYKTVDYGFSVPYYIIMHKGRACHLEQQLFNHERLIQAFKDCENGEAWRITGYAYPRNKFNLFWEYAKKDLGVYFSIKVWRKISARF